MSASNRKRINPIDAAQRRGESPTRLDVIAYINETPDLKGLLYDLDLLPEQTRRSPANRSRMIRLAVWWWAIVEPRGLKKRAKSSKRGIALRLRGSR